jgi:Domain of unknown function (DUF4168)
MIHRFMSFHHSTQTTRRSIPHRLTSKHRAIAGLFVALGAVLVFSPEVNAQQAPGDIGKYTQVARQIEQQRLKYYAEVKQIMGGNVPENVCTQGNLPANVRQVCNRFNEAVRDVLSDNRMPTDEFKRLKEFCDRTPKPGSCP